MAITYVSTVALPTELQPKRQRGGWTPQPHPRIALVLGSDDKLFLLQNETNVSWVVYHNFHQPGIIDLTNYWPSTSGNIARLVSDPVT